MDLSRNGIFFEKGGVLASSVKDKYRDYGLVGVICYNAGKFVQIAMSCRVLGLEMEASVLRKLMAEEQLQIYDANIEKLSRTWYVAIFS